MFEFEEDLIYTGVSVRESKKTGNKYTLLNFLDDEGQSQSAIVECNLPDLKQLDNIMVRFKLQLGRYIQLKVLDIQKV